MDSEPLFFSIFLIFATAAMLATVALFSRQPLIIVYIVTGMILGPSGLAFIDNHQLISDIAKFGIVFLLFLLGLDMQPAKLMKTFKSAAWVCLCSSVIFFVVGLAAASLFGFALIEALIIGVAMVFSSTIIGIKLLPTTVLHHRHTGELMISLLLVQDLIAIVVLLVLTGGFLEAPDMSKVIRIIIGFPLLIGLAWLFVKFVLLKLLERFDAFHEYIFLAAIGWCLALAEMSETMGLSLEIGAFVAGITIATSPVALYIVDHLKPLRDFFLILFFFSIGAGFHMELLSQVALAAIALAVTILIVKPVVFKFLLRTVSETHSLGWEAGFRLGQISEFSLLIAFLATAEGMISQQASHLIQATAIITFLVSTYIVVFNYPTPIATSARLRRD